MKVLAILVAMIILLMVGFGLMYIGFRGMVASPSSLGMEALTFFAGVICLIAGLVTGVYLLEPRRES
ncbi:MAG TPA: hypothetical protein VF458_17955 [Ktedonobacteraceae bacterium]